MTKEHPQRVRDMKRLEISLLCLKIQYNATTKNTHKIKTNNTQKIIKKAHENIHPQKVNVEKTLSESLLWDSNSCEYNGQHDRGPARFHCSTFSLYITLEKISNLNWYLIYL